MNTTTYTLALLIIGSSAVPAIAHPEKVDVALVLAVDVSASIDEQEMEIQRDGYRSAFRDPRIAAAITGNRHGRTAVAMFGFAGPREHKMVVDWTIIKDSADAHAFADEIARLLNRPTQNDSGTALGAALMRAESLLNACPCEAERRVVDVSGDGEDNRGPSLDQARASLLAVDTTINGLPISINADSADIVTYFEEKVIGGEGAFVNPVYKISSFTLAIIQKLIYEIAAKSDPPLIDVVDAR